MAAELTTKTVADVVLAVQRTFGDEDAIQVSPADIIRWINSGQREIVSHNPVLQVSLANDMTPGVSTLDIPTNKIQYVQQIFVDGRPIDEYSYNDALEYMQPYLDQTGKTDRTVTNTNMDPSIWWQWAGKINFFPVPYRTLVGGIRLDAVMIPAEVTDQMSPLSLPDRYFEALVQYVLKEARTLDETYDAASFHLSNFNNQIGQLSDQENRVQVRTYPTISVRDDDEW